MKIVIDSSSCKSPKKVNTGDGKSHRILLKQLGPNLKNLKDLILNPPLLYISKYMALISRSTPNF